MVDVLVRPLHAGWEKDHSVHLFTHAFRASEWGEEEEWEEEEDKWEEDEDEDDEDWDEDDEDWDDDEWEEEEEWEEGEVGLRRNSRNGEWD